MGGGDGGDEDQDTVLRSSKLKTVIFSIQMGSGSRIKKMIVRRLI